MGEKNKRLETGDGSQEMGDGRQETRDGDGSWVTRGKRQETEYRRLETGDKRQKIGDIGDGKLENGRQEACDGAVRKEMGGKRQIVRMETRDGRIHFFFFFYLLKNNDYTVGIQQTNGANVW